MVEPVLSGTKPPSVLFNLEGLHLPSNSLLQVETAQDPLQLHTGA